MIILQADNHNYLSGITKAGKELIMVAKPAPDVYCEFRLNKLEGAVEGLFGFKQLLDCTSVKTHTPEDMNQLKQKKSSIDQYCKFKVQEFKQARSCYNIGKQQSMLDSHKS